MSIKPIVRSIEVRTTPDQTFALFTSKMSVWWPAGKTPGARPHSTIVLEPFAEGRWFERDDTGAETLWGKVLAWEPPHRLLLGWQLNGRFAYDESLLTEVEVTFTASAPGTTVRLEHRDLERFGSDAERMAEQIGSGWPQRLNDFATYVAVHGAGGR